MTPVPELWMVGSESYEIQATAAVEAVPTVEGFPGVAAGGTCSEAAGEERRIAVGRVGVAFLHCPGGIDEAGHVPVGILQGIEAFRTAVAQHEIVDVSHTPHELPIGGGGCTHPLLDVPPVTGVVAMPSLRQHARRVRQDHRPEGSGVVLILLNGLGGGRIDQLHQPVPGIVGRRIGSTQIGRFGNRTHVASRVVGRGGPTRAGRSRNSGDFVHRVGRTGLTERPRAAAGRFVEAHPVPRRVERPALLERG